ncbi:hypothetical protein HMPREF1316_2246 [Olsenella profusa F0195]|uniref:Uncharacterized protein n=1 Tax=Olsenella profusa F0195 TaxID=1125712 RepID=U2TNG1_9ACTN|nr:hypothetical protein HMPREF1316_2246 [Olsenella profusa F0195]
MFLASTSDAMGATNGMRGEIHALSCCRIVTFSSLWRYGEWGL